MKIMIHALGATMGGAMRHLTNFLPELGHLDKENFYTILVRESMPEFVLPKNFAIERVSDKKGANLVDRLLFDLFVIPRRLRKESFDLIVSLTNFGPIWTPCNHIFFQRNPVYYSQYYWKQLGAKEKLDLFLRRSLAFLSMNFASATVAPSDAMIQMIKETFPSLSSAQFKKLYHGFDIKSYAYKPLACEVENKLLREGFKVLYPTHPGLHKGFEILFESISILKERRNDFTVFLTIDDNSKESDNPKELKRYNKLIREFKIKSHVVFLGKMPQDEMRALYDACDVMVYPSIAESFGFSLIEALGIGLPIIASDTNLNKEICANSACYYPMFSAKDCTEKLEKSFNQSMEEKKELIANGQRRAKELNLSWERYAESFLQLINGTVRGKSC
ncbi:MAG: glycosyltransferase [Nitrospinae bacterium]|nr:glycosyltransferase [Nitrospinota bacterium]